MKNNGHPLIDNRDMDALVRQMRQLVPFYTPEWRFSPEDPDPGTALFLLFAQMYEGNLKRLNQMPYKHFIGFLNLLDVSLQTARPAQAYLTFKLSEGAREAVLVPAGTAVTAQVEGKEAPVRFETSEAQLVTPALPVELLHVSTRHDRIARLEHILRQDALVPRTEDGSLETAVLYDVQSGTNLQLHSLFVRHEELFLLEQTAVIELEISNSAKRYAEAQTAAQLADRNAVEWLYRGADGWKPFDRVTAKGSRVRLYKEQPGELVQADIQGVTGRWIQCRIKSLSREHGTPQHAAIELDRLRIKTDYWEAGRELAAERMNLQLPPRRERRATEAKSNPAAAATRPYGLPADRLYYNDMQVEPEGFYPFGQFFAPYGTFYIASREALSKRGGYIRLRFNLDGREHRLLPDKPPEINWKMIMKRSEVDKADIPDPVTAAKVMWEYWNGQTWVRLPVPKTAETVFYQPHEAGLQQFGFRCPDDLQETFVNSEWNYWIRARIVHVENAYSPNAVYHAPWVEQVRMDYAYDMPEKAPDSCLTVNNVQWLDRSREAALGGLPFTPFYQLPGEAPALYFGFELPPVRGPISLYFSLQPQKRLGEEVPFIEWEVLRQRGMDGEWAPLKTVDATKGFTQSGTVQFAGPMDMARMQLFGRELYWIRAVNRDNKYEAAEGGAPLPRTYGIYANTIQVVQQETIRGEIAEKSDVFDPLGLNREAFVLSQAPILSEEVWVDETADVTEEDIRRLEEAKHQLEAIRDSEGYLQRCWVRYVPVEHFLASGPYDRHYIIDRSTGRLRFGDGRQGKALPGTGEEKVKVHYRVGGGAVGNVGAGQISSLLNSFAFIQSVSNPEPATGGCDSEALNDALRRGPKQVQHRGRAVTVEDFEWLAREAHPNIAKVKCLPGLNVRLEPQHGCMTLVVFPRNGRDAALFFPDLKKQVEQALRQRAAYAVAQPGSIQVIEPAYLEISLYAELAVKELEAVVPTERLALDKIKRFLDPNHGNFDGKGWQIGQALHVSMFYALLKSIGSLHHVVKLSMSVFRLEDGERIEMRPDAIGSVPHGMIISGIHKVVVEPL
ncbi:putative baseplate assembly protein [Paenibacillus sp. y28]|uniref:putative baseplate assembly protein n=1 Tax=Paenibacillus sp. y28 TaxID=3129110 RepID=UPI0030175E6B